MPRRRHHAFRCRYDQLADGPNVISTAKRRRRREKRAQQALKDAME